LDLFASREPLKLVTQLFISEDWIHGYVQMQCRMAGVPDF